MEKFEYQIPSLLRTIVYRFIYNAKPFLQYLLSTKRYEPDYNILLT